MLWICIYLKTALGSAGNLIYINYYINATLIWKQLRIWRVHRFFKPIFYLQIKQNRFLLCNEYVIVL